MSRICYLNQILQYQTMGKHIPRNRYQVLTFRLEIEADYTANRLPKPTLPQPIGYPHRPYRILDRTEPNTIIHQVTDADAMCSSQLVWFDLIY